MYRLENALQQARLSDGLRQPFLPPYSARSMNQKAFGIHEFTASHWVRYRCPFGCMATSKNQPMCERATCQHVAYLVKYGRRLPIVTSLQLKVFASKPLKLGHDDVHILCPPFSELVPVLSKTILLIGGHDTLETMKIEILESVATCVESGGVLLLLENVSRPSGIPVARQHHLSSCVSPLVTHLMSQIPLRVDGNGRDRLTPRQALAATLAPGTRTILYSKKLHPETSCSTSCQRIVGSFHGQVSKTNEQVCILCEFHNEVLSGRGSRQPLAASIRIGKGCILHVALTLGNVANSELCKITIFGKFYLLILF